MGVCNAPESGHRRKNGQRADSDTSREQKNGLDAGQPDLRLQRMRLMFARVTLFVSSYAPLLVVIALLDSFGSWIVSVACLALAGGSLLALWLALRSWRTLATTRVVTARARHRDADAIAYVAGYLVPFVSLGASDWRERAALLIFLGLLAILYIQAHLFYVNPVLALVGFRLFELETDTGRIMLLITKRSFLQARARIDVHTVSDYVFLEADSHPESE